MTNTVQLIEELTMELRDSVGHMETLSEMPEAIGCVCDEGDIESEECICIDENGGIKRITDKEKLIAGAEKYLEESKKKTFAEELAGLIEKHAKRSEESNSGYLVELKSGKYLEIEIHNDTNDLNEFMERE